MSSNTGGRPKGSVNKTNHSAGGARVGAGRKRVRPAEESAPQAVTVNESGPSRIRSSPYTTSAPGKQV